MPRMELMSCFEPWSVRYDVYLWTFARLFRVDRVRESPRLTSLRALHRPVLLR